MNKLLKDFNREKEHVGEAFYQVRNLIVHDFRSITKRDKKLVLLKSINIDFELLITDILTFYIEPEVESIEEINSPIAWLMYKIYSESN